MYHRTLPPLHHACMHACMRWVLSWYGHSARKQTARQLEGTKATARALIPAGSSQVMVLGRGWDTGTELYSVVDL